MLTPRVDEADRLTGLKPGADDCGQALGSRELVARAGAVLRRAGLEKEQAPVPIVAGDARIDLERRQVATGGKPVDADATEFRQPVILARHAGRVFTRLASKEPLGKDQAAAQIGADGAGRAGAFAPLMCV
jgi:DNA-binding response OmpR family regulator